MTPGFKRSRAIWDETKDGGTCAWINAICYELQPIRISRASLKEAYATLSSLLRNIISLLLSIAHVCKYTFTIISSQGWKQWLFAVAIFVYYWFIRWIHEALDAGPVVLILTALVLIFTIGLGDDESREELSAYSVFNKGFEQLLGSVDADSLLAQHLGGGAMMNLNRHHDAAQHQRDGDNGFAPNRRRHEEEDDDDDDNNNNNNNNQAVEDENDANAVDGRQDENINRARKSGKKARRRNLDQRREIRRQREMAAQINLDEARGEADEAIEIQRIIEDQINLDNNQRR